VSLLLGCIADDLTGATDLANTLVQAGMHTIQTVGVPQAGLGALDGATAVVVALKSRTIPAADAIEQSLTALTALQAAGMRQCLFKYCSTFDSTDQGNIGPVAEALMDALGDDFTIACPAFPENGRTVYKGHLFVGEQLLSDTHMRHHPLTPMTDSNLVRVLGRQSKGKVGLVPLEVVAAGAEAIARRFGELRGAGVRMAVVDAVTDNDLLVIGAACRDLKLVTGGSGIAIGLPENLRRGGLLPAASPETTLPPARGYAAVIAGSCSEATRDQVAHMSTHCPSFRIDPLDARSADQAIAALDWAGPRLADGPVLVYATASPDDVRKAQESLGVERAGAMVEVTLATVAKGLVQGGVGRMIVAGGETAGAVMQALGIRRLRIGPQIDPGVPWTMSLDEPVLHLALKSGNFGSTDFFLKALDRLG
jgi:uncharacterized protein YgbK (DUF1537 family)